MKTENVVKFSLLAIALMAGRAWACDNVFVQTMNNTVDSVNVGLTMNTSVPDSLGFSLGASGSRIDDLVVSPNSPNPMTLQATVSDGTLQGKCSVSVTNDNTTGQCTGIIDPKYQLVITKQDGTSDSACKHDNGNHIGEDWHKLGLKVGQDVPFHAGKLDSNGQPLCKEHGNKASTTTTTASISCTFALVSSF